MLETKFPGVKGIVSLKNIVDIYHIFTCFLTRKLTAKLLDILFNYFVECI